VQLHVNKNAKMNKKSTNTENIIILFVFNFDEVLICKSSVISFQHQTEKHSSLWYGAKGENVERNTAAGL
jgi:hypothetical protein